MQRVRQPGMSVDRMLRQAAAVLGLIMAILGAQEACAQSRTLSRPEAKSGPTTVSVGLWVVDVDSIDGAHQNFVASVYVALQWTDRRLASRGEEVRQYPLDAVWEPRVQIANEIGLVRKTLPETVEVTPDGTVTYRQRYVGPFSQPMRLRDFPFDTHVFRLHLVSPGRTREEIRFVPNPRYVAGGLRDAAGIAGDISLPDWRIVRYEAKELPYALVPGYEAAGYALEFTAERHSQYYVWKIILPLVLIVLMSWAVFLIDPTEAGTRIGVATSSMLTLIAYRFVVDSQVPRVPYLTRLDIFIFADTLLVLSSLFMVTLTASLVRSERQRVARTIDRIWRVVFLLVFGGILTKALFVGIG